MFFLGFDSSVLCWQHPQTYKILNEKALAKWNEDQGIVEVTKPKPALSESEIKQKQEDREREAEEKSLRHRSIGGRRAINGGIFSS